jgi:hypothetical protein
MKVRDFGGSVGRTPRSAADALVGLCGQEQEAGQGAGCRPVHHNAASRLIAIFEGDESRRGRLKARATSATE